LTFTNNPQKLEELLKSNNQSFTNIGITSKNSNFVIKNLLAAELPELKTYFENQYSKIFND
jgi:hypothetical protein